MGPTFAVFFISTFTSYAIVRYDLMEIKVIAKQALFYGVVVALTTALLSVVVLVSRFLEGDYPKLSLWLIPSLFSVLAVLLGVYIWRGMQASEALKHEFITVVTHKFRTPLTRVMWALEDLKLDELSEKQRENIKSIEKSSQNILELVNLLTTVSKEKGALHTLSKEVDLSKVLKERLEEHRLTASRKGVLFQENVDDGVIVYAQKSEMRFVMDVLIENALTYTPSGGKIFVTFTSDGKKVRFQVKDTGIGMNRKTQDLVFSTFFRGDEARLKHTEGLGVGLYVLKRIVDNIGGVTGFYSAGENKGSMFFFEIPIVRDLSGSSR